MQITGSFSVSGTLRVGPTSVLGAPTYGVNPQAIIAFSSSVFGGGTLDLRNTSATIAAGEFLGTIQFSGKDDASTAFSMAQIRATADRAPGGSDSGGGNLKFYTSPGGAGNPPVERMSISGSGLVNMTSGLVVTGSLLVTGSNTLIGTKTISGSVFITGSKTIIGTTTVTGSLFVSGSTTINNLLVLTPTTTTPVAGTAATGSIILSGSSGANLNLYVYTGGVTAAGNGWGKITIT